MSAYRASYVEVLALRPIAINHYLLYPGETRVVKASLARQLIQARPDALTLADTPVVAPADPLPPPAPVTEADTAEPPAPKRRGRKG